MALLTAACLAACAAERPFDSQAYLRQQFALQVGSARAAQIEVPFALDEPTRAAIELRVRPSGSEVQRANEITSFIFDSLDLLYEATPTRNAIETYRDHRGNCLSFVNLFMGVARLQRLNAFYVEVEDAQSWSYSRGTVVSQGHIVAGISVGGELKVYDFMPERPKSYRKFRPIDDLLATAHYFNNLGAEALLAGDVDTALARVRLATEIAPRFDKALNNLGVVLTRRGELAAAAEVFQRGLATAPQSEAILTNLLRTYQQLGRASEAEALFAQLDQQRVSNPLFFVYKGDRALARGDARSALEQMAEALRRGSDIAEVHVGLAKVYIALGDLEKARHHLGRALRLDASQEEARRLEKMLGDR